MSFRRALITFAVSVSVPLTASVPAALAQDARQVDIGYEITFAGFAGFRIDVTARFDGASYDVESRTFKEGMLRAVTMHYDGRNRAWGGFSPQGAQPTAGSLSIVVGDKPRTWVAQYGAGGTMSEKHNPEWKPPPQHVIPEDQRTGSLDPLSAALTVGLAGDAACDRTVPTNDGKRRIDIMIHKIGMESPATAGVPTARGDLLVCQLYTKRVAGEFEDSPKEAETKREQPMKVWFARFDNSQVRYPAKLEASTGFGTIRGKVLWFRERAMTPQESQAMRR
jgi:hypothetical protein